MLDLYFGHICHATVCLSELQFPPDHTTLTTHPLLLRPSVNPSGASNVKHQQLKQGRHTQMQLTTDTISPDLYYLSLVFLSRPVAEREAVVYAQYQLAQRQRLGEELRRHGPQPVGKA